MDPAPLAARLQAIEGRLACTDAERRAAAACTEELRRLGRRPRTRTLWVRRSWSLPHAAHAAVGVAGSLLVIGHEIVGAALAGGALVATLAEAWGLPIVGLLLTRRATQNVIAEPRAATTGGVRLVLTAAVDAPRDSVLAGLERRLRATVRPDRRLRALLPGPVGLLVAALAVVAACAGGRVAGGGGVALGIAQLVPSVVLILLFGAFLDDAAAGPLENAPAGGPAAALAVAAALASRPPRRLAVEVVIAGAGEAGALGLRRYVAQHRHELAPEDVVVLHLASANGPPRFLRRDGRGLAVRLHPRLVGLAEEIAAAEPRLRAGGTEGRAVSGARAARSARWPALALEGDPRPLAELVLRLVARVDRELGDAATGVSARP